MAPAAANEAVVIEPNLADLEKVLRERGGR